MRIPWTRSVSGAASARRWAGLLGLILLAGAGPARAKDAPAVLDAQQMAARIDFHIAADWKQNKITAAAPAHDAEFLRRAYLDIVGRIPTVEDVHKFLADRSPDKRVRLVNRLLDTAGYVNNFANVWRDLMVPQNNNPFVQNFGPALEAWLAHKLRSNLPYDQMVRELLTANPLSGVRQVREARPDAMAAVDRNVTAFYQANEMKPENLAAATSRLFLGIRLECAQCHDHPFNSYSRDQFWEFAAFFAGMQGNDPMRGRAGRDDPTVTQIKIQGTEKTVKARFLDGKEPKWGDPVHARTTLAEWMTTADNPYFARAMANRTWAHFFGVGLIDPVDEPSDDNPPSHPELLDELARQFALNKFDIKWLIRSITASQAYQLTSVQNDKSQADPRRFARMSVKGLTPEQLWDSVVLATGYRDPQAAVARGQFRNRFQGVEGDFRNKFANYADKRTEFQTSILQALALMNGRFIADATSLQNSNTLASIIDAPFMETEGKLNALFLAALSRKMKAHEASKLVPYIERGGPTGDQARALSDVFWALLNSSEFILNH
jgi:hypothetical protein